ncbi:MAG: phosphoglucosamine mutase [Ruminococcaceae bacterium]|nr:phosphoglucosamine mutase [Oscillospiraceae bacterium]
MGKYFGTDGFRGEAGVTLTADHAYRIGRFLGYHFSKNGTKSVRVVIGKDTRRSSYMLEYAIASGLAATGADVYLLHVTTTPCVSYVVSSEDFDCGVMISASHNPFFDNGIKLVNRHGEKMDDETIALIEAYLDSEDRALPYAVGERIGKVIDHTAGRNRYLGYLIAVSQHSLRSYRIGLDCANGSSWMLAKAVFDALGAYTEVIHASPDGLNINRNAGSTHIESLCELVRERRLDIGFAFDGDADRCLAVDEHGQVINGDHVLYILANRLKARGELSGNTVVTTVMSNLGLYRALESAGIDSVQTRVGDRYIWECMREHGYCLGGEQSGHTIVSKYATTGDGILTAILLMEAVIEGRAPLSQLASAVRMLPQVTVNVRVSDKERAVNDSAVKRALEAVRTTLEDRGRVLLRQSGTEPVLRVMVEAPTETECQQLAESVADVIRSLEKTV